MFELKTQRTAYSLVRRTSFLLSSPQPSSSSLHDPQQEICCSEAVALAAHEDNRQVGQEEYAEVAVRRVEELLVSPVCISILHLVVHKRFKI